jgi:two-component system, NtrC family, response regulator HydG
MPGANAPPSSAVVVGQSALMRAAFDVVRLMSNSESTSVITGESGTGKEVMAGLIHQSSRRRHAPFVPVSCALFSEGLVESDLFGHDRGAFTGAIRERPGRFELAEGGTVFLDDIDDVPLSMQVKLLRVLQNRTVERLGGTRTVAVNVRVLAGSKRDLKQMVTQGKFREDLYYRLAVLTLTLPPLRDRREDIPALMSHFLEDHFRRRGEVMPNISPGVTEAFMRHDWPGNVRELENSCERIAQMCTCETLSLECPAMAGLSETAAPPAVLQRAPEAALDDSAEVFLDERLRTLERSLLNWAMAVCHGNRSKAAELLHIKRSTLVDRIKRCERMAPAPTVPSAAPCAPAPVAVDAAADRTMRCCR